MESDVPMPILVVPHLIKSATGHIIAHLRPTRLYKIPPPAAWRIQPIEASSPKTPATICPWEKLAMVLIRPAEPVANLVSA